MAEITLDRYQGGEYGVYDAQDDHIIGNSETAFTLNQLEAELAASKAQSAQLAAAGELLLAQVRNGMEISQGEYNYYPDDMDEAVTAWDTALAAWQQGNK
jgi:hypothetical protein